MRFKQEAKRFILGSFHKQSDVGTPIDERYIYQQGMRLDPPVKDAIESALDELIAEGFLDSNNTLTQKGFDLLFPPNKSAVRRELLSTCRDIRARAGDAVLSRPFQFKYIQFSKREKMDFDDVLTDLQNEGFIDENHCLTDSGYKALY